MSLTKADDMKISAELYAALTHGKDAKVIEICRGIPKGPMYTLTVHHDTVLSLATNLKKNDLALELLDMVPICDSHKLTWQNSGGNTILHETGTNNRTVEAAAEMIRRAPMLLSITNKLGETALFYAASLGKSKIYKFLHDEVMRTNPGPDLRNFLHRDDKSTILHRAILNGNYWMAHEISVKHDYLIHEKDGDHMTPFQLLSCHPPTFGSKSFFSGMIYKLIDANFEDTSKMLPWLRRIKKEKFKCEWAMKLIKLFATLDTSWEWTGSWMNKGRSTVHRYGKNRSAAEYQQMIAAAHEANVNRPDTPLLLATIHGCTEIVREIVKVYPQAIEHVDHDGRNILHVAILNRRSEIIDVLENMKYPKERLRGKIDNYGNSLLHLVGEKVDDLTEDIKGPALVLQEDALLFKRVKQICSTFDAMRLNSNGKTAEKVFFENNNKLRSDAKEWMSETAKNCSIVAVLIATVAFAAAYTVPGGPDPQSGYPVLRNKPLFLAFTIADAISLSSSLTSVIIFLNIVTSPFRFKDFEESLVRKLYIGLTLLMISVAMMMVAFAATLILIIRSGRKWTDVMLYGVSFFPVFVFMVMYLQFYGQLIAAVYKAFKQMKETALSRYFDRKPEAWHYKPRSRHQDIDSRILV